MPSPPNGLQLAELPRDVLAAIGELLPPFWSHGTPWTSSRRVAGACPRTSSSWSPARDAVDAVLTLALIGSPSSGRGAGREAAAPKDPRAES